MVDAGLTERELSSVRKLAFCEDRFEPFPATVIPRETLNRLVAAGIAETGRSCSPAVGLVGYRLTDDGWRVARDNWTSRPVLMVEA